MNVTVRLLLILLKSSFMSTVYAKSLKPESKIVGGHEARPHSHPYLVSLQSRFLWVRIHTCGGAILNKRWVLSAAHCALESWLIRWLPLDVVAGIHDVNKFGIQAQVIKISERIPHPLYEGSIGPHDIAVFGTVSPFIFTKYVQPVKLPNNYKTNGLRLKLAGWGALKTTVFIPDLPSRLQEVKVTYIPYEECYKAVEELKESGEVNPLDEEANICTGPTTGGVAACNGDSGGPLIQYVPSSNAVLNNSIEENIEPFKSTNHESNNERTTEKIEDIDLQDKQYSEGFIPVILGVVSWGISPCGETGAPTIYTNVSTYIDFINYNIREV